MQSLIVSQICSSSILKYQKCILYQTFFVVENLSLFFVYRLLTVCHISTELQNFFLIYTTIFLISRLSLYYR